MLSSCFQDISCQVQDPWEVEVHLSWLARYLRPVVLLAHLVMYEKRGRMSVCPAVPLGAALSNTPPAQHHIHPQLPLPIALSTLHASAPRAPYTPDRRPYDASDSTLCSPCPMQPLHVLYVPRSTRHAARSKTLSTPRGTHHPRTHHARRPARPRVEHQAPRDKQELPAALMSLGYNLYARDGASLAHAKLSQLHTQISDSLVRTKLTHLYTQAWGVGWGGALSGAREEKGRIYQPQPFFNFIIRTQPLLDFLRLTITTLWVGWG